ncbi:MAG: hypothetical protein KDJ87_08000 [Rhizobiaceae bacterium]|nr:hypothetical protein [Rhizobiaceae bacterium]
MGYEAADRILSVSFARDAEEHADVMLTAGRRMLAGPARISAWAAFAAAVGFGVAVGILMEIHRRLVLPLVLGPAEPAPLGTVVLQLLPLILMIAALYILLYRRAVRRRRAALVARLTPGVVIDVDIFPKGVAMASDRVAIEVDWPAVRDVFAGANRIEMECEAFSLYIPERAFPDHAAFTRAGREVRNLWRAALKQERDSRMSEAGLD